MLPFLTYLAETKRDKTFKQWFVTGVTKVVTLEDVMCRDGHDKR